MKTNTKRLLSLLLCLAMVLVMLPMAVFAEDAALVLYVKPNSNWVKDGARFAAYFFGSAGDAWASATLVEGEADIYAVTVPNGFAAGDKVIFCRMSGSTTDNNWDNKWNQTADLPIPNDGTNLYTVASGTWDQGGGTWSTYTSEPTPDPEPAPDPEPEPAETYEFTVYCINAAKWDAVTAYVWNASDAFATWPGTPMTKTEQTVNGFDIYAVTITSDAVYDSVIFNDNNNGQQSMDLAVMDGQYFDNKDSVWYASLEEVPALDPLATDAYLVGGFNSWSTSANEFRLDAEGSVTGVVSLELEAETTYEFKIVKDGTWLGNELEVIGSETGMVFDASTAGNAKLTTTVAGTYTFAFNVAESTLSITYPETPEEPALPNPTKIEGLAAGEVTRTSFTVSWNAANNVVKYWVFVNGTAYSNTTETTMTVTNRKAGTQYQVAVTALLKDGSVLKLAEAETVDIQTVSYSCSASTASTADSVTISWQAADATKTWIYGGTSADSLQLLASSTGSAYTLSGLQSNTTYYFELAHCIDGKIVKTGEVLQVKTESRAVSMSVGETVQLSWNANGDSYKYWVFVQTADKEYIYATTETAFVIPNLTAEEVANVTITVKGINSNGMYTYDTVS